MQTLHGHLEISKGTVFYLRSLVIDIFQHGKKFVSPRGHCVYHSSDNCITLYLFKGCLFVINTPFQPLLKLQIIIFNLTILNYIPVCTHVN